METTSKFIHPNQWHIIGYDNYSQCEGKPDYIGFQSYCSYICEYRPKENRLVFYSDWNYSMTTVRHFYAWCRRFVPMNLEDINRKFFLNVVKNGDTKSFGVEVCYRECFEWK